MAVGPQYPSAAREGAPMRSPPVADRILAVPEEIASDKLQSLQDPGRLKDLRRQIAEMILRTG